MMVNIKECKRKNTCYDCDNERCLHHGKKEADCPKYRCDRQGDGFMECDKCGFIDRFIKEERQHYKAEREKAINEWLDIHCRRCANNDDRGTDFVNCQAECEVQKDVGIACIHYEEMAEAWVNEAIRRCIERKDNT